jgi:hypothetical protein
LPDFYALSPATHGQFNVTATPDKQVAGVRVHLSSSLLSSFGLRVFLLDIFCLLCFAFVSLISPYQYNTGAMNLSALYSSPTTQTVGSGVYTYPGAYTSNDRANASRLSQQSKDAGKPKDPFFFGDIKTLDLSL